MIIKFKNFYKKFGYYYFRTWAWHIIAIGCLLTQDLALAGYAVVVFLLFYPLTQVISHDYVAHEYCLPKNTFCKFIALTVWYMWGQTIQGKKNYHIWHHMHYNSDVDPTRMLCQNKSLFRYLFSLHEPQSQNIGIVSKGTLTNDPVIGFLDKYADYIYWLSIAALLIILPLEWFIIFRVYTAWYMALATKFHDWYFHGQGPSVDSTILLPIYSSAAYHNKHHDDWREEFHGVNILRFFNLCWWYRQLMFKPKYD